MIILLAILTSLVPAVVWAVFVYTRDRYEPEPKSLIVRLFLWGMLAGPWASGLNILIAQFLSPAVDATQRAGALPATVALLLAMVALSALNEETMKYVVVSSRVRGDPSFTEPVDGIIYMSTAALGFAAGENFVYIVNTYYGVVSNNGPAARAFVDAFLITAPLRALLSTLGHVTWSGIVGHHLSEHVLRKASGRSLVGGVLFAGAIHTAFNLPLFLQELGLPIAWISWLVWIFGLERYITLFGHALQESPFRPRTAAANADASDGFRRRRAHQLPVLGAITLVGGGLAALASALRAPDSLSFTLGFLALMAAVAFNRFNWRCPNCYAYLGRAGMDPKRCPTCGALLAATPSR